MKKFNHILSEIRLLNIAKEHDSIDMHSHPKGNHISTTKSGHQIFVNHVPASIHNPKNYNVSIHAFNPHTNQIDMHIHGKLTKHNNKNSKLLSDMNVTGRKNSSLKAHELYHHLITKHNYVVQSDDIQSGGGVKIWRKLHKNKDLHVHKWDDKKQKASHTSRIGLGYTHSKSDIDNSKTNLRLIAHKGQK